MYEVTSQLAGSGFGKEALDSIDLIQRVENAFGCERFGLVRVDFCTIQLVVDISSDASSHVDLSVYSILSVFLSSKWSGETAISKNLVKDHVRKCQVLGAVL